MQSRIVLISEDSDFFEYILPKLNFRKSDELYRFTFEDVLSKLHLLSVSLLIINCEGHKAQTLDLLNLVKGIPAIVFEFNEDAKFKIDAYKAGMFSYITLMTNEEEFNAQLLPALGVVSLLEKTYLYREILVKNNLLTENNEVFLDYNNLLDRELEKIKSNSGG